MVDLWRSEINLRWQPWPSILLETGRLVVRHCRLAVLPAPRASLVLTSHFPVGVLGWLMQARAPDSTSLQGIQTQVLTVAQLAVDPLSHLSDTSKKILRGCSVSVASKLPAFVVYWECLNNRMITGGILQMASGSLDGTVVILSVGHQQKLTFIAL